MLCNHAGQRRNYRREFKNEREEWEKFVEEIPRDSKVAIEACSYWYPVCDFLEERGIEMILSHPSKTRIIAEAKIKTDKIDSKNLAKLLRADFLPQSYRAKREGKANLFDQTFLKFDEEVLLELKEKKGIKIAVVATARELLRVNCMLTRKEDYKFERKALTEIKLKRLEKTGR